MTTGPAGGLKEALYCEFSYVASCKKIYLFHRIRIAETSHALSLQQHFLSKVVLSYKKTSASKIKLKSISLEVKKWKKTIFLKNIFYKLTGHIRFFLQNTILKKLYNSVDRYAQIMQLYTHENNIKYR